METVGGYFRNACLDQQRVNVELPGFKRTQHDLNLVALQPGSSDTLEVAVSVRAVNVTSNALNSLTVDGVSKFEDQIRKNRAEQLSRRRQNVIEPCSAA